MGDLDRKEMLEKFATFKPNAPDAAIALKTNGNEYVQKGKFERAMECYSAALKANFDDDSLKSILYSNRAHVSLQ